MRYGERLATVAVLASVSALGCVPAFADPGGVAHRLLNPGVNAKGTQGYLGVDIRDISDEQLSSLKLKEARGAEVVLVDHDGPACKAGLMLHDVILQMNGQTIEGEEQLRRMLKETPAGRAVTLMVSRDGQPVTIRTQMANREELERQAWDRHYIVPEPVTQEEKAVSAPARSSRSTSDFSAKTNSFFKALTPTMTPKGQKSALGAVMLSAASTGAMLELMGPQLAEFFGVTSGPALLVHRVDPDSPAAAAGMKAGDVVVKVNSAPVTTGADWLRTVHESKGKAVSVVILREKKQQTLTLTPDGKKRSSVELPAGDDQAMVTTRIGLPL